MRMSEEKGKKEERFQQRERETNAQEGECEEVVVLAPAGRFKSGVRITCNTTAL